MPLCHWVDVPLDMHEQVVYMGCTTLFVGGTYILPAPFEGEGPFEEAAFGG